MKKFTLLLLVVATAFACKKDDDGGSAEPPYPTDGLTLEERKNSLLITPYGPGTSSSASLEIFRQAMEYEFEDKLSHISLVAAMGHPLYSPISDSLYNYFGSPGIGTFILNGLDYDISGLQDAIELAELEKPAILLAHKVTEYDSAWVVDVKLEFKVDTVSTNFYIETYMVADVPALNYKDEMLDLRMPALENVIGMTEDQSFWATNVISLDSTIITTQGETYIHNNIAMSYFSQKDAFGTDLSTINPLGVEFFKNDVYGTRVTPIRHYFTKPKVTAQELPFEFEPRFVTVIWYRDFINGSVNYINSYSDQENDD